MNDLDYKMNDLDECLDSHYKNKNNNNNDMIIIHAIHYRNLLSYLTKTSELCKIVCLAISIIIIITFIGIVASQRCVLNCSY